MLIDTNYTGKI